MPKETINGREPDFSEEDIQREQFGPRGVPGKDDPATMTPSAKRSSRRTSIPATRHNYPLLAVPKRVCSGHF